MGFDPEVERLFVKWSNLRDQGQQVTAEALCEEEMLPEREEIVQQLKQRIDAVEQNTKVATSTLNTVRSQLDLSRISDTSSDSHPDVTVDLNTIQANVDPDKKAASKTESPEHDLVCVTRFANLRFFAQGGVGELYKSADVDFGRDVVLKFIRPDQKQNARTNRMFFLEGEVTARLEHPGVVPIYGFGSTSDGRPFYAMRLIKGQSLGSYVKEFHNNDWKNQHAGVFDVAFRKLLSQFVSACKTIAYAHSRGILHRDIKPDNIMLGRYGETLVVDWGLARAFTRDEVAKESGEATIMPRDPEFAKGVVGTPIYMSPEQADDSLVVSKGTDIYSLGATLYTILTGKLPFEGSLNSVLQKVRRGDIQPPTSVANVPRALGAICVKAMALDPADRYESALELADDVEHYLAGELVQAYEEPWTIRYKRWVRRHSILAQTALAGVLVVTVATTAFCTASWKHRGLMIDKQMDHFASKADVEEVMLKSQIRSLEKDVQFLASRPEIEDVFKKTKNTAEQPMALNRVVTLFQDFIERKHSYMQVRVIAPDGQEVVRVERKKPGEESIKSDLQKKRAKPYVTEPMKPGVDVFLSKFDLNREHGKIDWNFPVIRAASPIEVDGEKLGIVVVNMHFSRLSEVIKDSADEKGLVYLTNDNGQFLMHPVSYLNFSFEKDLDYGIVDLYPELSSFVSSRDSGKTELPNPRIKPKMSVLIRHNSEDKKAAEIELSDLHSAVLEQHPHLRSSFSEERNEVILQGINQTVLDQIRDSVKLDYGGRLRVHQLPTRYPDQYQSVYCRKIFFDERDRTRFLNLVQVEPLE